MKAPEAKKRITPVTVSLFCVELRTLEEWQPSIARILDYCCVLFANIINFVWCQMVLIVYFCLQIRKIWEHLYWSPLQGLWMWPLSFWNRCLDVSLKSHEARKPNLLLICGETDQSFLLKFHIADHFCFLFKSNIDICPSVLTVC